jgi:hypothetical protein
MAAKNGILFLKWVPLTGNFLCQAALVSSASVFHDQVQYVSLQDELAMRSISMNGYGVTTVSSIRTSSSALRMMPRLVLSNTL